MKSVPLFDEINIDMNTTITHPVVGLGGTHIRYGFAQRTVSDNRFSGMPSLAGTPVRIECIREGDAVDLKRTLALAAKGLRGSLPDNVTRFVGIDAPGAWQENGLPYLGTTPNIPDLGSYRLAEQFPKMFGPGWKAAVNNDGVANVLAIAQMLLTNLDRFPEIQKILRGQNAGLAGFVPGTGFGAGAFRINNGLAQPVPGPQQFFDIMLWEGSDFLKCGWVTPETACAGTGFKFQAERSLLGERYPKEKITGNFLRKLAFLNDPTTAREERAVALNIYRTAAKGLAETMKLTYSGREPGRSRKAVVNTPNDVESDFWENVQGTRVFILGGWLTDPSVKGFISRELTRELEGFETKLFPIFADEIPGVKEMIQSDSTELIGASLLMPEEYAKG